MGCASSKHLETVLKAEGFETVTNHQGSHHHHDVSLTSTTYGLLNSDSLQSDIQREQHTGKSFESSKNHVYEKLKSFELNSESGPQSWSEVSKVLEDLKPGLEKKNPAKITDGKFEAAESWDVVDVVDESNQPAKTNVGRKKRNFDSSKISYHTVEELDAKLGIARSGEKKIGSESEKPARIGRISNPFEAGNLQKKPPKAENFSQSGVPSSRNVGGSADLGPRQERQKNYRGPNLDLSMGGERDKSGLNMGMADPAMEPSSPLFDPELLASFETALKNLSDDDWNAVKNKGPDKEKCGFDVAEDKTSEVADKKENGPPQKSLCPVSPLVRPKINLLNSFEEKCPPGGEKAVVLYTTTLRGIRKTFEDCNNVRSVLESFGVSIDERDVSMHLEFRNELRELMGKPMPVPRLFIKGRHIGGVEEVLQLHEEDKLRQLLRGVSTNVAGKVCDGCGGMRFVPCLECSGSCKLINDDNSVVRCPDCNENGLIQCPICC